MWGVCRFPGVICVQAHVSGVTGVAGGESLEDMTARNQVAPQDPAQTHANATLGTHTCTHRHTHLHITHSTHTSPHILRCCFT